MRKTAVQSTNHAHQSVQKHADHRVRRQHLFALLHVSKDARVVMVPCCMMGNASNHITVLVKWTVNFTTQGLSSLKIVRNGNIQLNFII